MAEGGVEVFYFSEKMMLGDPHEIIIIIPATILHCAFRVNYSDSINKCITSELQRKARLIPYFFCNIYA